MRKRIWKIFVVIFIIGVIIAIFINLFSSSNQYTLPTDDDYLAEQSDAHEEYVANQFPDIPVKQEIPYFSSDEYFDYRIMPSFEIPEKFDVYLTPRFSDVNTIEEVFSSSQNNIIQWIANHDTLISNIQIDWYIIYNNEKVLVDQTNPNA